MEPECECGHMLDEHALEGDCQVEGCPCIMFDQAPNEHSASEEEA